MKKLNSLKSSKSWYTSKTLWISIATAVVGILMSISESISETGGEAGILVTIIGVINGVLRFVTTQPIK